MPTVFLDAVFKPFFKIVHDTGQQLTIDRTNFLTDGFLQIIQRTGFVSGNTWFQILPKEKITRKIGRARGPRHVSEMGNEVPGKHVSNNCHWCGAQLAKSPLLLKWPTQRKRIPTIPPPAYLLSTTHSKDVRFPWVTLYMLTLCRIMSGEALMHYYNRINQLIVWYGWTLCDLVSFVADMGQQSSLNLLVLNGKWSSCEWTVFT